MSLRRVLGLGAVALAVALVAAFVVAALRSPREGAARLAGPPVSVTHALAPEEPQFGDTVIATTSVFVDPARVDPASVRVGTAYAPYVVLSRSQSVRRTGGVTVVRVVERLACLDIACVPTGAASSFRFSPVRVSYRRGGRPIVATVRGSPLHVHGRVTAAEMRTPFLRVGDPTTISGRYPRSPRATGIVLLVLAALAALAGAFALGRVAIRLRRVRRSSETPLQRVLLELGAASTNGDASRRRRALDALARELAPLDVALADESRSLAWAPIEPDAQAVAQLTKRVEEAVTR